MTQLHTADPTAAFSRRDFLKAGPALAAGIVMAGGLAVGCSARAPGEHGLDLYLDEKTLDKLRNMWSAGWKSVCWRQDHYPTGGIVESDERADDGRKLYWPWCWPRTYVVEPMLKQKYFDRVRRFLEFREKC